MTSVSLQFFFRTFSGSAQHMSHWEIPVLVAASRHRCWISGWIHKNRQKIQWSLRRILQHVLSMCINAPPPSSYRTKMPWKRCLLKCIPVSCKKQLYPPLSTRGNLGSEDSRVLTYFTEISFQHRISIYLDIGAVFCYCVPCCRFHEYTAHPESADFSSFKLLALCWGAVQ